MNTIQNGLYVREMNRSKHLLPIFDGGNPGRISLGLFPLGNYPEIHPCRADRTGGSHFRKGGGILSVSFAHDRCGAGVFATACRPGAGGLRLLLSEYPTGDSRILFHRQIEERVHALAPFLEFDDDPYIVLEGERLYWIIDAYTTSADYPYSEPFYGGQAMAGSSTVYRPETLKHFARRNYVRNAVKAVVDAYDGSVDFCVFDNKDPLILTWRNVFPELFKDRESMPGELARHVRYPSDMLMLQGLMYAKYHMTHPTAFYNQEDLWVRATEKYYDQVQPVEPYYMM